MIGARQLFCCHIVSTFILLSLKIWYAWWEKVLERILQGAMYSVALMVGAGLRGPIF